MLLTKFYNIEYEQQLLAIIDKYSKNIMMCFTMVIGVVRSSEQQGKFRKLEHFF
jgi:hypothetical protein